MTQNSPTDYLIEVGNDAFVITAFDYDDADAQFKKHGYDSVRLGMTCLNTKPPLLGGIVQTDIDGVTVTARRLERLP